MQPGTTLWCLKINQGEFGEIFYSPESCGEEICHRGFSSIAAAELRLSVGDIKGQNQI